MQNRSAPIFLKCLAVALVGVLCGLFALALKTLTETSEHFLFNTVNNGFSWLLFLMPFVGLMLILLLTRNLFHTSISGIREILDSLREPMQTLRPIKAVIHFFSGFLTIVFGGSTGIEVSAVVASAATGSWTGQRWGFSEDFRKKLIVAGAAAGIAGLFQSPLAGIFFAAEVLMVNFSWELIAFGTIASFTSFGITYSFGTGKMFHPFVTGWQWDNIPYFIFFSAITALLSVFLTRGVIKSKEVFNTRLSGMGKVLVGGIFLGLIIIIFTPLYGEGYSSIDLLLNNELPARGITAISGLLLIGLLLLLKPFATAITLAAGGDGGVFAPSLFLGAVAGYLFSHIITYLGGSVIEINFIIVGMAGILGASLHAPLTAAFLTMSITGSYELLIPILLTADLSAWIAKRIYPFTVYSYSS